MSSDKSAPRVSSQMEAVYRVMAGKEERTIAEKLADPNRPTWEQYKKENEDKLNLSGVDQQKMEEYRAELDREREARLARGTNHGKKKKSSKKRRHRDEDDSSDDDSDDDSRQKRKRKKKSSKKRKKRYSDSDSEASDDRRRKKHRKKKNKKRPRDKDGSDNDEDDRYRLSSFFNK